MGAEESRQTRRPQPREPNWTDLHQILQQQRQEYNQKCQEHQRAQRGSTQTPSPTQATGDSRRPVPAPRPRTGEYAPNRNSFASTTPTTNRVSAADDAALSLQRQEYERRCREHEQAFANLTVTQSGGSQQNQPSVTNNTTAPATPKPAVNSATPNTSNGFPQPVQVNPTETLPRCLPPLPRTFEPATNNTDPSTSTSSCFERDRTPYSYTRHDLATSSSPSNNVNPPLNDFVFVNNSDYQRPCAPSRERSASRTRPKIGGNNDNDKHACPTCKSALGITIYNCPSGHGSCKDCKARLAPCGVCGLQLTDIRNRALEAFMAEIKYPCPNSGDGCCLHIKQAELEFHLKECPFKELQCPLVSIYKNCSWRGKLSNVSEHVSEAHPQNCHINMDTEAYLPNICFDDQVMHFITMGPFKFVFTLKVCSSDRMIYVLAQLLGTQVSAYKWNYEIQVYNKREPRRKYQYVDVCQSASVPINDIIKDANCAAIPLQHALTYINEGVLTYKFYIKQASEEKKEFVKKNYRGRGGQRRR